MGGEGPIYGGVTDIVTVVAAEAIKSVKSGIASKCVRRPRAGGSRVANVVTVVVPAVAIKSVTSGIYEGGQEHVEGRGWDGGEQRGVMWCKVNRPTKVHMLRFSGTV